MSEQEKRTAEDELAKTVSTLPPALQNRFVDQIKGAALALDTLKGEAS